jgi:STE24 endopeptidase
MAQIILYLIIGFIVLEFLFSKWLSLLNRATWDKPIPAELADVYDAEKFEKAKEYAKENERVSVISSAISLVASLAMLFFKGFAFVDQWAGTMSSNSIFRGLIFFGVLSVGNFLIGLPFQFYSTFVIEEKYGFNKTTVTTFILDLLKSTVLGVIIGGGLYSLLCFLFGTLGDSFWIVAWAVVAGFSLFMAMFYTSILLPLFNKLVPLEEGELRAKIEKYAQRVGFPLTNIFIMDGSKRSTKANAFFSGLGSKKNIVLFDTLVNEMNQDEITAVLAHEVGHYKKKHITKSIVISILQMGLMFFVFGWMAKSPLMADVLGAKENSFHLALVTFSMLFSPISLVTGILGNLYSRKNEYEADAYAKDTFSALPLVSALKKMTVNHLSNPQPHPYYIFVHYSHPTLLQRMKALGD